MVFQQLLLAVVESRRSPKNYKELVTFLMARAAADLRVDPVPAVTPAALRALAAHDWPGNIRELDNELRRAMTFRIDPIDAQHLSDRLSQAAVDAMVPALGKGGTFREAVAAYEKELIISALRHTGNSAGDASKLLGLSRSVFYAKMKRYGIRAGER